MNIAYKRSLLGGSKLTKGFMAVSAAAVLAAGFVFNAMAASTVVVTPDDTQGWTDGSAAGGSVTYVEGGLEGYGDSTLQLQTGGENDSRATYTQPADVALSDVNDVSYWTKQLEASSEGGTAGFALGVDLNGDGSPDTNLIFEPYWQNDGVPDPSPVFANEWQQWDVDQGLFWSSRSYDGETLDLTAGAGGPPFYTLAQLNEAFPNAQVQSYAVNVGTYNTNYTILVDGVQFNDTVYDFEQVVVDTTAPDAAITSPLDGTTVNGDVTLGATFTDDNELLRYYYYVADSEGNRVVGPQTVTVDGTSATLSRTIDTSTWADGEYVFQVEVRDAAGNKDAGSVARVTFTVNNYADNKDECKKGGWEVLSRTDGSSFKNQGQCVAYVVSSDNSKHKRD